MSVISSFKKLAQFKKYFEKQDMECFSSKSLITSYKLFLNF